MPNWLQSLPSGYRDLLVDDVQQTKFAALNLKSGPGISLSPADNVSAGRNDVVLSASASLTEGLLLADLRESDTTKQKLIYRKGTASAGDGTEGWFTWDPSDLSTEVAADTQAGIYVAPNSDLTGASGAWVRVRDSEDFNVRWFGADSTGATDATAAINAAIVALNAAGRGTLHLPRGTYAVSTAITPPTVPFVVKGDGIGVTVIDWANTAHCFDTGIQAAGSQEFASFENFSVVGKWAELLPTLGTTTPFRIYGVDDITFHRVSIQNCAWFGYTLRACSRVLVSECEVFEVARDGISCDSCVQVQVSDCRIDHCDDDAIVVHLAENSTAGFKSAAVITGNRITDSQGIVCLGARRFVIEDNQLERIRLRGIRVGPGIDGYIATSYSGVISGNVITDVYNRNTIDGLSNAADYITIGSDPEVGTGVAVPGLPDGTGTFEPLDEALDNNDTGDPIAPAHWIIVSNNVLARTLPIGVAYSTYGHGEMFTRNGYLDPTIDAAIAVTSTTGANFPDGARYCKVGGNIIRGIASPVRFVGATADIQDITIENNDISRFNNGIVFGGNVTGGRNIIVQNNTFDGDPYHEDSNRGANGTWLVDGGPSGILAQNAKGLIVKHNIFRRVCRISDKVSTAGVDNVLFERNIIECNPASTGFSTSNEGIGNIPRAGDKFIPVIVDDDPASATFGQTLNVCQTDSNAMPTSGTYVAGHRVYNNTQSPVGPRSWFRLTTGSSHVLGVDWAAEDSSAITSNAETGTTYTFVEGDAGKLVTLTNAAAIALTIPDDATTDFPVNTIIDAYQGGAGQVTFAGESVATIECRSSHTKFEGQGAHVRFWKRGPNDWVAFGHTAA